MDFEVDLYRGVKSSTEVRLSLFMYISVNELIGSVPQTRVRELCWIQWTLTWCSNAAFLRGHQETPEVILILYYPDFNSDKSLL